MNITVTNSQELKNRIIEAKIGIKMSKDILEQVKLFEHRKQVNKTFTDSFEALGYHAYIIKNNWSSKIVIRKRIDDENYVDCGAPYVEISIYNRDITEKLGFSWENIKNEIARYNYLERLREAEEALNVLDSEILDFEKFVNYVQQQEFKCINLWSVKRELQNALDCLRKKEVS